jgi:hypothetical protein
LLLDWPFVGLGAAVVLLALNGYWPRLDRSLPRWRDPLWLVWLGLPMYMLHMFEEHGYDLLGERYHFRVFMCTTLGFASRLDQCPADEWFIFMVNVVAVWGANLLAFRRSPSQFYVAACTYGIPLVNGFAHLVPGILSGHYNPGVLTSALFFEPVSWWVLYQFVKQGVLPARLVPMVVISGVLLHAVMLISLQAMIHELIGHGLLLFIQAMLGWVPFAVGTTAWKLSRPAVAVAR